MPEMSCLPLPHLMGIDNARHRVESDCRDDAARLAFKRHTFTCTSQPAQNERGQDGCQDPESVNSLFHSLLLFDVCRLPGFEQQRDRTAAWCDTPVAVSCN